VIRTSRIPDSGAGWREVWLLSGCAIGVDRWPPDTRESIKVENGQTGDTEADLVTSPCIERSGEKRKKRPSKIALQQV
jgi:hypothetical protein